MATWLIAPDLRDPSLRLESLFDHGTVVLLDEPNDSGVLSARGLIAGEPAFAYATDARTMGGALGLEGCRRIVATLDRAVEARLPVLGLWHSGGARLVDGVASLHGVGEVFAAMVRASGRVPHISVILGPAAGGAAYGPALGDVIVMSANGRVFVTGPDVVRSVTGEQVDMESLGGPDIHSRKSGVVHVTTPDDATAMATARELAGLLGRPGRLVVVDAVDTGDLSSLLPESTHRAYDVRPLVRAILDAPGVELHPRWAPNIVTQLGRFAGRTVGVIANNPLRLGGCLDSASAEKAARFVRMCDSLAVPLVVLVDVPGYLPGVAQEWDGVVRRGAKLLHAFAEAVVPRVTLITRKAYGGAYIAMNSRALGASAVFAWPGAEVAVMGASAAVGILHRRALAAVEGAERDELRATLIEEHERLSGGVERAIELGVVDRVVPPSKTRQAIAEALAATPFGRGFHTNIPL